MGVCIYIQMRNFDFPNIHQDNYVTYKILMEFDLAFLFAKYRLR